MMGLPLPWVSTDPRGILDFADLHIPRSLRTARKRSKLRMTIDTAFKRVICRCASTPRPDQPGTWITPGMIRTYTKLHNEGTAHSVEAWDGRTLVGGIYGIDAGGAFSAESMFFLKPNASKLALLHLIDHLKSRGLDWLDIEVVTPHMEVLGAKAIPRAVFLKRLAKALKRGLTLF
jgi:leucyl/phenylalanyl-tRNA--protein transferase